MSDRKQFFDNDPIIQRLRLGKARIEKGWCKEALWDGDKCCALGAIAREPWADVDDLESDGSALLTRALPIIWDSVPDFNNASSTTRKDVLALFDRAIALRMAELTEKVE